MEVLHWKGPGQTTEIRRRATHHVCDKNRSGLEKQILETVLPFP
jgi:hypothetical protein